MTGSSDEKDRKEKNRSAPTDDASPRAPAGATRAKGSDRDVDDWLTRNLSAYYDDLLNEPMPDTIVDLLRKLETKEIKK